MTIKKMSNEILKEVVNASGWAVLGYQLKREGIEEVIKKLDELETIPAINEILERLKNTECSYKNVEKLKERISHYEAKKEEFAKYYEIYNEKIKREKYRYDTTDDCLKIIRSASIEITNEWHWGLSLTHYKASNWSYMVEMINDNLGWGVEDDFTEEQEYKWKQIEKDLPEVLKKIINNYKE